MTTLKAERRSVEMKAKRLRREGFVTGNVIGRELSANGRASPKRRIRCEVRNRKAWRGMT